MGCTELKKDDCLNNVCRDYDKCRPDLAHSTTPSAGFTGCTQAELEEVKWLYQRLGRFAELSDVTCSYLLRFKNAPKEVTEAAREIMDYVDSVRP